MEVLNELRERIDEIDKKIVEAIGQRLQICRNVAQIKKENSIPMMQSNRVEEVLRRVGSLAKSANLRPEFIQNIYRLMIDEACRIEDLLMSSREESSGGQ